MRLSLPIDWRFWCALLMCPLLLTLLGIERHAAWLDAGTAHVKSSLIAGIHPSSFYFTDRSQLIGAKADGAKLTLSPQGGFLVQPTSEHISFSLALKQPINPKDVAEMILHIDHPAPAFQFALVLQEGAAESAASPAWISELISRDTSKLDLTRAIFTRNGSQGGEARSWTSLPTSHYLRLYVHVPTRASFGLKSLWFRLDANGIKRLRAEIKPAEFANFGALAPAALLVVMMLWTLSVLPVWRGLAARSASAPIGLAVLVFLPGFVLLSFAWGFSMPGPFDLNWPDAWVDVQASLREFRFSKVLLSQLLGIAWLLAALLLALRYALISGPISPDLPAKIQNQLTLIAALAGAAVILIAAGLPENLPNLARLLGYLGFALVQQFLLQRVVLRALLDSFSQHFAILLAALMFALWHSPNTTLMLTCFVGALYACGLSVRGVDWRRLALLHALLGTLLVMCFPTDVLKNAEIGSRHFTLAASER